MKCGLARRYVYVCGFYLEVSGSNISIVIEQRADGFLVLLLGTSENQALCEVMWKKVIEPYKNQMAI